MSYITVKDSISIVLVESTSNKALEMVELMREAKYSSKQIVNDVKQLNLIKCKKKRKDVIASMCHALTMVLVGQPCQEESWYESVCTQ